MKLSVCLFQSLVFWVIKSTDFDEKNFWLYNTIHQGKISILFNFEKGWLILSSLKSQKLTKISRKKVSGRPSQSFYFSGALYQRFTEQPGAQCLSVSQWTHNIYRGRMMKYRATFWLSVIFVIEFLHFTPQINTMKYICKKHNNEWKKWTVSTLINYRSCFNGMLCLISDCTETNPDRKLTSFSRPHWNLHAVEVATQIIYVTMTGQRPKINYKCRYF